MSSAKVTERPLPLKDDTSLVTFSNHYTLIQNAGTTRTCLPQNSREVRNVLENVLSWQTTFHPRAERLCVSAADDSYTMFMKECRQF